MAMMMGGPPAFRALVNDGAARGARLPPGTIGRIIGYARPHWRSIVVFLLVTSFSAGIVVANPLLLKAIIDRGIAHGDASLVTGLALAVGALALLESVLGLTGRWLSARIGEGVIYLLRTQVFTHVQRMPLAFFTRTQTGSLISRLNTDVVGAQRAITSVLQSVVSNLISAVAVLVTMMALSWQITLVALLLVPLFVLPAKFIGRKVATVSRDGMELNAEMSSLMTERFNVGGAMLVKLYGRPEEESRGFARRAGMVRDIGVTQSVFGGLLFTLIGLITALATATVYGIGGNLVIGGAFELGTLVALTTLLTRLYGPITALSNVHVEVMTALVSFDRVFEILDLKPMIEDAPDAAPLPEGPLRVEFDRVSFRYPSAEESSLDSLELMPHAETLDDTQVLSEVSFAAAPGQLVALVGPSGAGKTTLTHLVSRLYDPTEGSVRIGGLDLRGVEGQSLRDTVGVVTQDTQLFHDTVGANLRYARPDADDDELIAAMRAAQLGHLLDALPDGLETMVGDRGYRLSGGEKQRLAIARLLLKAPSVVVLDEATAHLDSESEAAVQEALRTALAGRTSLVIAHRLATVREADQILVLEDGRLLERGTHEELLAHGGLYTALYRTQFAAQEKRGAAR
ncbi:ATP-binding cassette subfamily B protein [Spinactinospora alkalitolerans]|uniref:ATP-binding cassette subfamily B protein n=1 Tax=Spinactinospora alkalitolerans TaxID=687207 RepID=A0A852TSR9_9ACTN|nr:ABC transporter ATP-binding protein [Spinactinospora alkalitolerans]NYE46327.1 ATP-binding cassette subfamily B protein [Spinactinospora alkalitolerans]